MKYNKLLWVYFFLKNEKLEKFFEIIINLFNKLITQIKD